VVHHIYQDRHSGRVIFTFHVEHWTKIRTMLKGPFVNKELRLKLRQRAILNDFPYAIVKVDTVVCQNNCSGHGSCNLFTKRCICDAFWMENFLKARATGTSWQDVGESNCDWSILYVIIIVFVLVLGKFHDQGDAKWIVIRGQLWGLKDMPPAGLSAARGLAAHRAYLVVSVTIN
jgi:hypothetical protein